MEEKFLTIEQVAEILKVTTQTVWIRCKQGKLPALKLPGSRRWLISKKEFEKQLNELMKKI
jgi:excisionase family DNA binding protein